MSDVSPDLAAINAEIAARETASSSGAPINPDLAAINEEIASRGIDPTAVAAPAQATAPSGPPPSLGDYAMRGATSMGQSLIAALHAGSQGTSPIVRRLDGTLNYKVAPDEIQQQLGVDGAEIPQDNQKYVSLIDPQTNQLTAYYRDPKTDESPLASIGRLIGIGNLTGAPRIAGAVAGAAAPTAAQSLVSDFDRVGVQPSIPAVTQSAPVALAQNALANVPIVNGPIKAGAQQMISQTADAADRLANAYGAAQTPEEAGKAIQAGVTDFAKGNNPDLTPDQVIAQPTRDSSVAQKSAALYDQVDKFVPTDTPVDMTNTLAALKGPSDRFTTNPALGSQITNSKLASLYNTVAPQTTETPAVLSSLVDASGDPIVKQAAQTLTTGGNLSLGEAKEFRSFIGRQLGDPTLISDIPRGDLKQVYGAMSDDLGNAIDATGNPQAVQAYQRANDYYGAAMDRVDNLENLLNKSPEGALASVQTAAGNGPGANIGQLRALQRSLDPDQWGNVGAAVIRKMGAPLPGTKDPLDPADFSAGTFVTNYNRLADPAKDVLFGGQSSDLRQQLDSLARVAAAQKNVAKLANTSNTQNSAALLGLGGAFVASPVRTVIGLLGGRAAASAMMNPSFTRWMVNLPTVSQVGDKAANAADTVNSSLAQLDNIVRSAPELQPVAQQLHAQLQTAQAPTADENQGE